MKATDRAIRVSGEQRNDEMLRTLEANPRPEDLIQVGIRLPDRKARRTSRREAEFA